MKKYIYFIIMVLIQASVFGQTDTLAEKSFDASKPDVRMKHNFNSILNMEGEVEELEFIISKVDSQLSLKIESSIEELRRDIQTSQHIIDSLDAANNTLISALNTENASLKKSISTLESDLENLKSLIVINSELLSKNLESINSDLSTKIKDQQSSFDELVIETDSLEESLAVTSEKANDSVVKGDENYLYIKIAIGVIVLLLIISLVMYRITQSNRRNLEQTSQDVSTLHALQQGLEKLLVKQNDIISKGSSGEGSSTDILPLVKSLADDIIKLDHIIFMMDPNAKGLKHIKRTVKSQRTNLKVETGYEVPDLLGVEIKPGEFIDFENQKIDPSLEIGVRIISRVIKPKILKNGEIIQKPKVEISTNNG